MECHVTIIDDVSALKTETAARGARAANVTAAPLMDTAYRAGSAAAPRPSGARRLLPSAGSARAAAASSIAHGVTLDAG